MAPSAGSSEIEITKTSAWRLTLSGTVLFLLQYAIGMFLSMAIFMPTMFLYIFPNLEAVTNSDDPQAFFEVFRVFPLLFLGMIALQIFATALALGFVVGKRWGGARLVFIRDE